MLHCGVLRGLLSPPVSYLKRLRLILAVKLYQQADNLFILEDLHLLGSTHRFSSNKNERSQT